MPLEPGTTLGPHNVTAKIGEGSMEQVYRAGDRVPGDSSLGYRGGAGTSLRTQPSPLVSR